jgi:hypothetical protein
MSTIEVTLALYGNARHFAIFEGMRAFSRTATEPMISQRGLRLVGVSFLSSYMISCNGSEKHLSHEKSNFVFKFTRTPQTPR